MMVCLHRYREKNGGHIAFINPAEVRKGSLTVPTAPSEPHLTDCSSDLKGKQCRTSGTDMNTRQSRGGDPMTRMKILFYLQLIL